MQPTISYRKKSVEEKGSCKDIKEKPFRRAVWLTSANWEEFFMTWYYFNRKYGFSGE